MIKLLFILLLVIFPLGQVPRIELGGGLNILLNDVIVGAIVLLWIVKKITAKKSLPKNSLTKPILFFAFVAGLSLVINSRLLTMPEFLVSGLYLARWIAYAGLFFVVADFPDKIKAKIPIWLLYAGTATAVLGLVQYFLYPNLRNLFYAGWDEHLYRLFATFYDPNFAGGIFTLTSLLAIYLYFKSQKNLAEKYLLATLGFLSFIALLLTYSRGSYVGFVVGLITLLILMKRRRLIVGLLAAFIAGIVLLPKDLAGEGVRLLRTASIESRIEEAQTAITIFRDNPVIGVGFNAYKYAKAAKGLATTNEFGEIHSAAGTDNSFLFVLAITGIVGFAAYVYLWIKVVGEVRREPLILGSLFAIFVHAFFVNSLFYPHIMMWLWVLIGFSKART